MGCHPNISFEQFPKQGDWVGRRVKVCFHYDISKIIFGSIVRQDIEEPGELIISLTDGRFVRAVECMYSFAKSS